VVFFLIRLFIDQGCYQLEEGCYSVYGFEYKPGFDDAVRIFYAIIGNVEL
jgi:hypothetical protein